MCIINILVYLVVYGVCLMTPIINLNDMCDQTVWQWAFYSYEGCFAKEDTLA